MKKQEDEFVRKRRARQKMIRRRRRIRLAMVLAVLAVVTVCVLSVTVLFPIKTITVTGSKRYDADSVIAASGIKAGDNILIASEKKCCEQLRRQLPYVSEVSFKRSLSGALTLCIKEATEAKAFLFADTYYLVSSEHHILRQTDELPDGMLVIAADISKPVPGNDIVFTSGKTQKTIDDIFSSAKASGVKLNRIDLREEIDIHIKAEGRFAVRFGTGNYLEKKMNHFAGMVRKMDSAKTGTVDLSMWTPDHPEGIFVEKSIE